ncbi:ACP S-malonyltransferase [Paraeggerthella sp.]|uniref:ACP S-malonyltransferase n=1 Tax=Paraeggerthella sp. TaxID=2897350 RepID=UPI003AB563C4
MADTQFAEGLRTGAPSVPRMLPGRPVFMLSGQGSQKPGMGESLLDLPEVAEVFSCASDVLGYNVADLVSNASADQLNDTRYAQPALCALSIGAARALEARGAEPIAVLGFSLGQVSALAVSGMLSDEATFAFVRERSRLMAEAAAAQPGAMSALLKADEESVRALCAECAQGGVLVPANYNCPGQIVVSGTPEAIERIEAAWADQGGRFSRLATSGGFHSPLMADAAVELARYLDGVEFAEPRVPLICNLSAAPLDTARARTRLVEHLTGPVRFQQSIEALAAAGADTFVEAGYGGVLANLVKRIDRSFTRCCVQDRTSLEACAATCCASDSEEETL